MVSEGISASGLGIPEPGHCGSPGVPLLEWTLRLLNLEVNHFFSTSSWSAMKNKSGEEKGQVKGLQTKTKWSQGSEAASGQSCVSPALTR